jgi:CLIP-associating protein 1/2
MHPLVSPTESNVSHELAPKNIADPNIAPVTSLAPIAMEGDADAIDPAYINSVRELEDMFREMQMHFEGRESEQNWIPREKSMLRLRRVLKGNVLDDYSVQFLAGVRTILDGILKCVTSLRTTLSTKGCYLVQELARAVGPGLDPMVEILLQSLIKLSAGTKKIAAHNGFQSVQAVLAHVSYSLRLVQHIWNAVQDKNVQPRSYASAWLEVLLQKHCQHRNQLEHGGGMELIEKVIRKGLSDPNPGVRAGMRKTFWTFSAAFPDRGDA